jgi:hypothetical protein
MRFESRAWRWVEMNSSSDMEDVDDVIEEGEGKDFEESAELL